MSSTRASSSQAHAYHTGQMATIMNATQQVKERCGARAHAHEARADRNFTRLREKNDQGHCISSSDCLWNLNFKFLRASSDTGFLNMFKPS